MVEKLRPMPDQLPDNPATIAATTSIETIESILYRDWVWRNTFYIDTTMQPGTIFGTIKIHPKNCNDYITHISAMFKTWVGSMKLRARFMATFQFGGSFRMGWLPPIYNEQELMQLPIQTLTAYPNIDLDPKNTGWNEFQAAEERNILFHWMEDVETQNSAAFGGWYVFYVAAPLVVSGGTNSQISLLIESTGSFNFAQLAPITALGEGSNAWINNDPIGSQIGTEDSTYVSHIQVLPGAVKSIPNGFLRASALSGVGPKSNPVITLSATMANYLDNHVRGYSRCSGKVVATLGEGTYNNYITWNDDIDCMTTSICDGTPIATNHTFDDFGTCTKIWKPTGSNWTLALASTITSAISDVWVRFSSYPPGNEDVPIDINQLKILNSDTTTHDTSNLTNTLDESIVTFVNTYNRTLNIQTLSQAAQLKDAAQSLDRFTSQLYQVVNADNGNVIMNVRLTPYGYFTTNSLSAVALLPAKTLYFRYLQNLPMSSPLPPLPSEMRRTMRKVQRLTAAGNLSAIQEEI